jgi:hypothetical protein
VGFGDRGLSVGGINQQFDFNYSLLILLKIKSKEYGTQDCLS